MINVIHHFFDIISNFANGNNVKKTMADNIYHTKISHMELSRKELSHGELATGEISNSELGTAKWI